MKYFSDLKGLFEKVQASDKKGRKMPLEKSISEAIGLISQQSKKGNKIILIGNGGSAAIASHILTDFIKNANIPALAFNDSSLITCLTNDLGYEYVFEKPVEILSKKGDILFSISSSGKSKNILNAAKKAKGKGCFVVTFSGFDKSNPLRKLGDINFYVPSFSYGYVEIVHMAICHLLVDYFKVEKYG